MNKQQFLAAILAIAQLFALSPIPIHSESASGAGSITWEAPASSAKLIRAEEGGEVALGEAKVVIPPGALRKDTEIRITRLATVAETGESLSNATQGGGGYRFEPAGMRFEREARIELPYDRRLEGKAGSLEELRSYYYDVEERRWAGLERRDLDELRGILASGTTHFTDMINGTLSAPESAGPIDVNLNSIKGLEAADPGAGVGKLEFQGGNSDGSAGFHLAVEAPAGRNGMTPRVAITYNSSGGHGIAGKGFDVQYGSQIAMDRRYGAARYDGNDRYTLDGVKLEPISGTEGPSGAAIVEYRSMRETAYSRIEHIRDGNYWLVTEKDGRKKTYGKSGDSWGGKSAAEKNLWNLELEEDVHGNTIWREYLKDEGMVYPLEIGYTGHGAEDKGTRLIAFDYEDREDKRIDMSGGYERTTGKRLKEITVSGYGAEGNGAPEWRILRRYELEYYELAVDGWLESMTKSVSGYGGEDEETWWRHEFEYYELGKDEEGLPQYFGEAKPWGNAPLTETRSVQNGTQFSSGAGVGVGPGAGSLDARVSGGLQFSSGEGAVYTRQMLVDLDGDGLTDSVRQAGDKLYARRNTWQGFEANETEIANLAWLKNVEVEKEETWSGGDGTNVYGGLTYMASVASAGVGTSKSKSRGGGDVTSSFMDLDGDGLTDIVKSGASTYYRNVSNSGTIAFVETAILLAAAVTTDDEELKEAEKDEYHETYYIQRPFRMWKAPYGGTLRLEQSVAADGGAEKRGVVEARTYANGSQMPGAEIKVTGAGTGQSAGDTMVRENSRLYFIHDARGPDEDRRNVQDSDITWGINVQYTWVKPRRGTGELLTYVLPETIELYEYYRLPEVIQDLYYYDWYQGNDKEISWALIPKNNWDWGVNGDGPETELLRAALHEKGYYAPKVMTRERFEGIWRSRTPERASTLTGHYVYDAGRDEYRERAGSTVAYGASQELTAAEKRLALRDMTVEGVAPTAHLGRAVYRIEAEGALGARRSRQAEGSVFNNTELIILGEYQGKQTEVAKEAAGWVYRVGGQNANKTVTVKPKGTGQAAADEADLTITIEDAETELTIALSEPEAKAGAIEAKEMDAAWQDIIFAGLYDHSPYQYAGSYWAVIKQEDGEAFFSKPIANGTVTGAEVAAYFANCFDLEPVYKEQAAEDEEDEEAEPEIDYYEYRRKAGAGAAATAKAQQLLLAVERAYFLGEVFPCYREENGQYILKNEYKAANYLDAYIIALTKKYNLIKYQKAKKTLDYKATHIYQVKNGVYQYTFLNGLNLTDKESTANLLWNSSNGPSGENRSRDKVYRYVGGGRYEEYWDEPENMSEEELENEKLLDGMVSVNSDDLLYGGNEHWFYGVWIGDEGMSAFSEAALNQQYDEAKNTGSKLKDMSQEDRTTHMENNKDDEALKIERKHYAPQSAAAAREAYGEAFSQEGETGEPTTAGTTLVGEVTLKSTPGMNETTVEYFYPYITGNRIHLNRIGGTAFYELPGMSATAAPFGIGTVRRSRNKGEESGTTVGLSLASGNTSTNNGQGWMTETIQDLNGDGTGDLVKVVDGKIMAWHGRRKENGELEYGEAMEYKEAEHLSLTDNTVKSKGLGITAGPSSFITRDKHGKMMAINQPANPSLSASTTTAEGSNWQRIGMLDLNGDGISDYVERGTVQLGTGYGYHPYTMENMPELLSESTVDTSSVSLGVGMGGKLDGRADTTAMVSGGLGVGINQGSSHSSSQQMLLDINGDGLPDKVSKDGDGASLQVQFNTGTGFYEASQKIVLPAWGNNLLSKFANIAGSLDNQSRASLQDAPVIGSSYKVPGSMSLYNAGALKNNELDYSATYSQGMNGGVNGGGTVKIPIFIPFVPGPIVTINISGNANTGVNTNVGETSVTIKMMDVNGDGLVDQVMRIPGEGVWAKLNLSGKVGLLKTIRLPQGGQYELSYRREGNTRRMPQSRQVLKKVVLTDGRPLSVELAAGADQNREAIAHEYVTKYEYEDGYYDRYEKEFYGFQKVTTIARVDFQRSDDLSRTTASYFNEQYFSKGMEAERTIYNKAGNPVIITTNTLDAPYPRVKSSATRTYDEANPSLEKTTMRTWVYDENATGKSYGNVVEERDSGEDINDPLDDLIGYITYWHDESLYLHSHPSFIEVVDGMGAALRRREGLYSAKGQLAELREHTGQGTHLRREYGYDPVYGNLAMTRDSAGITLRYEYDEIARQHITEIRQEGSGASGEAYTSRMEWDTALGAKTKETDPNGNSMAYRYDSRGRLMEIRSPYDTGSVPAVSYRYETPEDAPWHAVTANKLTFDAGDPQVMLTVTELDGLGRLRRTAKAGEVHNPATKQTQRGWNVSGVVEYDGKGRAIREWQPVFMAAPPGEAGIETLLGSSQRLERSVKKEYDGLDRVVEETLPDGHTQETSYGIAAEGQDRYAYTQTIDPLKNQTKQYRDGRGNIVRVERRDAQERLLTKASYRYTGLGEMVLAEDAAGNPLRIAYDLLGRRVSLGSADSGRTDYGYNAQGQLWWESSEELRRQGKRIEYRYDTFGRLIKTDYPESVDAEYAYGGPDAAEDNLAGRLLWVSDESGATSYEYGKLGEAIKERRAMPQKTDGLGKSREAVMEYRSDYLGRMQEITYPDGEAVVYGYDYGGNVTSVTGEKRGETFPYVERIGYDEWGQRVYLKLGNGVETTYTYDENRRWLSRILTESGGQAGKSVLQEISYTFDAVGNVSAYQNKAGTYETEQEYAYDGLYQLVYTKGVSESKPFGSREYQAQYTQTYQFDAMGLGNMTKKRSATANSDDRRLGDPLDYEQDYEYAEGYAHRAERIGNRHYQYDLNGNVVIEQDGPFVTGGSTGSWTIRELENGTKVVDNGWGLSDNGATVAVPKVWKREYKWNERNLLRTSRDDQHIAEYTYGQDGERSGKYSMTADGGHRSETLYFNKMWAWHYDGLMNEVAGRNSKHVYLGESRIVTKISRADSSFMGEERIKQYYYHSDHLGSAQVISNAEGEEYERIEYTPYGELWIEKASSASNIDIPYRFTGKERDEETGLYYYGARYLDSKASRWLSADPAVGEYIPGAPVDDEARERNQSLPGMGGVFNLVNLHLYHYAGNNPVKYVDPDGKISVIPILVFAFVLVEGARLDNLTGKQVTGAINDFASQYQTMRKENIRGNDHYNHAMANSKAAQRGSLGKATAQVLSFAREAADVFLKGDTARDVREDNIANRHGRDISPNEDPAEHNAIFDTRREGHRAELPNVENTTPKNIKEFIDAYFTRDELE